MQGMRIASLFKVLSILGVNKYLSYDSDAGLKIWELEFNSHVGFFVTSCTDNAFSPNRADIYRIPVYYGCEAIMPVPSQIYLVAEVLILVYMVTAMRVTKTILLKARPVMQPMVTIFDNIFGTEY